MEYQSSVENLDEDGYTQLDFSSRNITRRSVVSEKGIWRSSSGNNLLKSDSIPSRNKDNQSQPTQSSLEDSVIPTKALRTTGKGRIRINKVLDSEGEGWFCYHLEKNEFKFTFSFSIIYTLETVFTSIFTNYASIVETIDINSIPYVCSNYYTVFYFNRFQIRSTVTEKDSSHNCVWIHVSDIYDQLCSVHSYSICEKK
ncbi:CLEC7A, partial [Cervus elaphus hippelaphus]